MSGFAEKMRQTWEQNILFSVLLELTYHCNLNCVFCYNEKNPQEKPIGRERYLKLFQELKSMGVFNLIFSGGEPLAHRDFFFLGRQAREMGFVIRIKSNGHALHRATARRLKEELDPFIIEISIHGACAETHDRQTRVQGSFDQLMQNLHILRAHKLRFQLNSVLTCWNENELTAMQRLARKFAAPLKFDSQITPRDNGDPSPLALAPSEQGLRHLLQIQLQSAPQGQGNTPSTRNYCGAGASTIAIDPAGNVYPCVQWRQAIGNVQNQNIREIWQNNTALADIRKSNEQARKNMLALGEKAAFGSFCPGMADLVGGNASTIYPSVHLRSKLRGEILNSTDRPKVR
ncbi:radical SAM/SPASM domain-containing protein [Thiolapillus sp.]